MAAWVWVLIAVGIVAVLAVVAWQALARRRSGRLQERFGPEYDRAVDSAESKRQAEAELQAREERRERLEIRPLSQSARVRYMETWRVTQAQFVDDPRSAVGSADRSRLPGRGLRAAGLGRLGRPSAGRRELPSGSPARAGERRRRRLDREPAPGDEALPCALRRARRAGRRRADGRRARERRRRGARRQRAKVRIATSPVCFVSTSFSDVAAPPSSNRRLPAPRTVGKTISRSSSTSPSASSARTS